MILIYLAALGYQIVALLACVAHLRRNDARSSKRPPVSILKPVYGADDHFYPAILSHAQIVYPAFEILFGIRDANDTALPHIRRLQTEFPHVSIRVVPDGGNTVALDAIGKVFELREFFEWRGLGSIDHSGVRMTEEYAQFDAERRFSVPALKIADPKSCQCGEVLKGVIKPWDCKVFGRDCTPETPLGALMVSSEGACAAYYQYGDIEKIHDTRALIEEMV